MDKDKHDRSVEKKSSNKWHDDGIDRMGMVDLMIERDRRYEPKKDVRRNPRRRSPSISRSYEDDRVIEMYKDYDLFLAAKNGDLDDFKRILHRVSTIELQVSNILSRLSPVGNTFLHVAAKYGNESIVNFIASTEPSLLSAKNFVGETALHLVAKDGNESMVKALVQIHRHSLVVSQPLPQNGGDENNLLMAKNERGNTALHEALFSGKTSIAQYLIQQDPELSYHRNMKAQSALYLAAKLGYLDCVSLILRLCVDEGRLHELFEKKSPIKVAIRRKHTEILEAIFSTNPKLIEMRDGKGENPLHFAASLGHLEEARYLLKKYAPNATRNDKNGRLPIHLASLKGHVDIISLLLQDFPDAGELLDTSGCNILHLAAMNGRYNVFTFVLKNPRLHYLVNMKDELGNTPLHWASIHSHPKIVNALTWNKKVDIKAVNYNRMTALDSAEYYMSYNPHFKQRLTWAALKAASVPRRSPNKKASDRSHSFDMDNYKERVNTLLLVATLVAMVTFAAGFTMPGGYISSETDSDSGMATMLRDKGFHVFVFCDSIAMYSSILVAASLIWTQLGDLTLVLTALTVAVPLLGIALIMMSMAFTAGVFIVVSKLEWLRTALLAMGISFVVFLFLVILPLCIQFTSTSRILRYLSYYPFCLLILVSGNQ